MPTFYSQEKTAARAGNKVDVTDWGGRVRAVTASIDWATINAGVALQATDQIELFDLPVGARVLMLILSPSVAIAGATAVAIGIAGATGKYRAAAALSLVADTPTLVAGEAATVSPLAAAETVLMTMGGASPTTGRCRVTCLYVLD